MGHTDMGAWDNVTRYGFLRLRQTHGGKLTGDKVADCAVLSAVMKKSTILPEEYDTLLSRLSEYGIGIESDLEG